MPGEKRKRTSLTWDYFIQAEDESEARCSLCPKVLKTTGGSTSGLGRHLSQTHNIHVTGPNKPGNASASSITKPDDVISKLAALDGLPFSMISSSKTFGEIFESAIKTQVPRSPSTIRDTILRCYAEKRGIVIDQIKKFKISHKRLSLTMDEWTSAANKRYLNVNVHGQGDFWNLGLAPITGSFNAQACYDLLKVKLGEFEISLEDDIFGIVTDGAAVMNSFVRLTGRKQQKCLAHGIHLAIADVLYQTNQSEEIEEVPDVHQPDDEDDESFSQPFQDAPGQTIQYEPNLNNIITTVRKIVRMFRKSPQKLQKLQSYSMNDKTLKMDTKTRWNSLLTMIERFLELKEAVQKAMIDYGEPMNLTEDDFETLQELIKVLQPVKVAVEALCRRDADLVTTDVALEFMMKKVAESRHEIGQRLLRSLKERIIQRRSTLSIVAEYLHYGNNRSEGSHPGEYFSTLSETSIISKIKELYELYLQEDNQTDSPADEIDSMEASESLLLEVSLEAQLNARIVQAREFKVDNGSSRQSRSMSSTIQNEMNLLMKTGKRGRILGAVSDMLMSLPPSSVEAERVFSAANNFCRKTRAKLSDRSLNALVFLKSYYKKCN